MLITEILKADNLGKSYIGSDMYYYTVAEEFGQVVLKRANGKNLTLTTKTLGMYFTEIKSQQKYSDIEFAEIGEVYYVPDLHSNIKTYKVNVYRGKEEEGYLYNNGLAFTNSEDALKEENFLRTLTRMRKFANKKNKGLLDWNNKKQIKYGIAYDYLTNKFWVTENRTDGNLFEVYFINERDCRICVENFRNELEKITKGGI